MNDPLAEKEKAILSLIDLYNEEAEEDRIYFLSNRKNNPDSGLNKEPFITFYKLFEAKVTGIEISELLYHFGILRLQKTFHFSHHAESLIQSFEKLEIPVPRFVLECQEEVIHREKFIKTYFEKETFKWSQSEKQDFLKDVEKEAKTHSFDPESEIQYLKKKFEETIQTVKDIEKEVTRRFGYYFNNFFDGEIFRLSKEDLNEYFYHSEIASGGCTSFFEVYKIFSRYIKAKNELFLLKEYLADKATSGPKQKPESNPLESIWMKNPSMTINEFLEKGQDLRLWDEEFNLIAKRGGIYGSGKTLLANIFIALKGKAIEEGIDHKKVGSVFCDLFKIEIDSNKGKPLKAFEKGNPNQIQELKKRLK